MLALLHELSALQASSAEPQGPGLCVHDLQAALAAAQEPAAAPELEEAQPPRERVSATMAQATSVEVEDGTSERVEKYMGIALVE